MSKISLTPNASGTGTLTIAAPNTSTDRTLTLPDSTGTIDTLSRAGNVLQVKTAKKTIGNTGTDADVQTVTISTYGGYSNAYQLLDLDITPQKSDSIILVRFTGMIMGTWASGDGGLNLFFGKDGSNLLTSGGDVNSIMFEFSTTALNAGYRAVSAEWSFISGQTTQMNIDVKVNNYNSSSSLWLQHDGSMHLTAMEIAA